MKFGIVVFPGANCDRDCFHVVQRVLGYEAVYLWHRDRDLQNVDAVVLPGGFSYGDYLRSGAIATISPIMEAIVGFAESGGPVLGICNGFQVLLESGLLPGAMRPNESLRFVCRDVHLRCLRTETAWSRRVGDDEILALPIAHAEGNYVIDRAGLASLREHDQIALEYCDPRGRVSEEANPNGSVANIAGICNRPGNVLGLMPHPERACEAILGGTDGRAIFESAVETL